MCSIQSLSKYVYKELDVWRFFFENPMMNGQTNASCHIKMPPNPKNGQQQLSGS